MYTKRTPPYNERLAEALYMMRQERPETYLEELLQYGIRPRLAQHLLRAYEVTHDLWTPAPGKSGHPRSMGERERKQQAAERRTSFEGQAETMYHLYKDGGLSLDAIASDHVPPITRERVRQIIRRYERMHNLPNSTPAARKVRHVLKAQRREKVQREQHPRRKRGPHPRRKLTQEQARYIRQAYMTEKTAVELAKEFNVNHGIIWMIAHNQIYREEI